VLRITKPASLIPKACDPPSNVSLLVKNKIKNIYIKVQYQVLPDTRIYLGKRP
jgi:hypothetical protein